MKQKIVFRLSMDGKRSLPKGLKCLIYALEIIIWNQRRISAAKIRVKAMEIAANCPGVASVAIQGDDKNNLMVTGENVNAYKLAKSIRQNVSFAEVLSMGPVEEKK